MVSTAEETHFLQESASILNIPRPPVGKDLPRETLR